MEGGPRRGELEGVTFSDSAVGSQFYKWFYLNHSVYDS